MVFFGGGNMGCGRYVRSWSNAVFLGLLGVAMGISPAARGAFLSDGGIKTLNQDFLSQNHTFYYEYPESRTWPGTLCDGAYSYQLNLQATLSNDSTIELNDDDTMHFDAVLENIYIHGEGDFSSSFSLCQPLHGWFGIGMDNAHFVGTVFLPDPTQSASSVKVQIDSINFGTIHLGKGVPKGFETFVTDLANRALTQSWGQSFKDWLSDWVSRYLAGQMGSHHQELAGQ